MIKTRESKDLLIKDLSARLFYEPFVAVYERYDDYEEDFCELHKLSLYDIEKFISNEYSNVKPYLFPLSSMTEKQEKEYSNYDGYLLIDWFNKNHFDYRGLIDKGLAVNATNLDIY